MLQTAKAKCVSAVFLKSRLLTTYRVPACFSQAKYASAFCSGLE